MFLLAFIRNAYYFGFVLAITPAFFNLNRESTMKETVTLSTFRDAFRTMNRNDHFSYEGLAVLFHDLTQYEEDCGQELELDVIAICCDFQEYTLEEANRDYSWDFETLDELAEHLHDETHVCGTPDKTVIFQCF